MVILLIISSSAYADKMDDAFNQREFWKNKTELQKPDNSTDGYIANNIKPDNFGHLDDAGLIQKGKEVKQRSSNGMLLDNSKIKMDEAKDIYQINDKNPWIKDSLEITKNPRKHVNTTESSVVETTENIPVKKSCITGVEFDIGVGSELVLNSYEEEYWGEWEEKEIDISHGWVWWSSARDHIVWIDRPWKGHFRVHIRGDESAQYKIREEIINILNSNSDKKISEDQVAKEIIVCGGIGHVIHFENKEHGWEKYRFKYKYRVPHKRMITESEYWQITTRPAEELVESNECYELSRSSIGGGVRKFHNKYDVNRPSWGENIRYRCVTDPKDGCNHLKKQNCQVESSECLRKIGGICMQWKYNYVCNKKRKKIEYKNNDKGIYCLGGDCHKPVIEENDDFSNVGYLAALNEAGKNCVKQPGKDICANPVTVFPGTNHNCKTLMTGAIKCCSSMKGWASNVGLSRCTGEEKALAIKRDRGLCHFIGTECVEKVLGRCIRKTSKFCCYDSKLSRIFHEEARNQNIGISWGGFSSPNCRALTLDELQKIDFSKLDLDELFDEMISKGKNNASKVMPSLPDNSMPTMQKNTMQPRSGNFDTDINNQAGNL